MTVVIARSVDEACAALAAEPAAQLLAGGTDFMVEVNAGQRRPEAVVAVNRIREIRGWGRINGEYWLGAGLTYTEMESPEFVAALPALAQAARTVGSPQIRNAGTLGGNLGTASPAGDTLPVLAAMDAVVELQSAAGSRELPLTDLITGVKQTALGQGELIVGVRVPALDGPQEFLKIGVRNAMVIAISSVALVVDPPSRTVAVGLGAVAPTPRRAPDAESWIAAEIDWDSGVVNHEVAVEFGDLVADVAAPIDDHRSTADYRRHTVSVMAQRALMRCFAG